MCRVNIGHLRVTVGHFIGHCGVTRSNHRLILVNLGLVQVMLLVNLGLVKDGPSPLIFFLQVNLRKTSHYSKDNCSILFWINMTNL